MSLRTSLGFFSAAVLATALNGCVATTDGSDGPDGAETTDATQDALTPTYEVDPVKPHAKLQAMLAHLLLGEAA